MSNPQSMRASKVFRAEDAQVKIWSSEHIQSSGQAQFESQLRAIQSQAYQKGYEKGQSEGEKAGFNKGYAEGQKKAQTEAHATREALKADIARRLEIFDQPFRELSEAVKQSLVQLVKNISEQLLRHQITQQPERILPLVEAALEYLPKGHQQVTIHLSSTDFAFFQQAGVLSDKGYQWLADDSLKTGDCLIESERTRIDARLEKQIESALSALLKQET